MPLHDWTRAPDYAYHDFHGRWLYAIREALNRGVLPDGYYARAEQITQGMGPDVLALKGRPDGRLPPGVRVGNTGAERLAVATAPPRVRLSAATARRRGRGTGWRSATAAGTRWWRSSNWCRPATRPPASRSGRSCGRRCGR